jgi:hypothetical protein
LITSLACNLGTLIDIKYDDPAILSAEKILGTQEAIAEEIFYEQLTATAYALDDLKALATEIASSVGNQDSDDSIQEDDCAGLTLEECIVLGTYTYTQYYEEFGHCRGDENRSGPREDADFTIGFILSMVISCCSAKPLDGI